MRLSPVSMNYNNRFAKPSQNKCPINKKNKMITFEGGFKNIDGRNFFKLLNGAVSEVIETNDIRQLNKIFQSLFNKHADNNVRGAAIIQISNNDLKDFLGKNLNNYDTKGKVGYCVAVSETYGPVNTWNKIIEAKTILIPEILTNFNFN